MSQGSRQSDRFTLLKCWCIQRARHLLELPALHTAIATPVISDGCNESGLKGQAFILGSRRQHDLGMDTECHEQHSDPLPSFSSRRQNQILGGHTVGGCQRHGWRSGLSGVAGSATQNVVLASGSGVRREH